MAGKVDQAWTVPGSVVKERKAHEENGGERREDPEYPRLALKHARLVVALLGQLIATFSVPRRPSGMVGFVLMAVSAFLYTGSSYSIIYTQAPAASVCVARDRGALARV